MIQAILQYFSIAHLPPERRRTLAAFYVGILFSSSAHYFYLGLFGLAGPSFLFYFNIGSILIFAWALILVKKESIKWAIILIFIEVDLHSTVAAFVLGWDYYFQFNILPLSMGLFLLPRGNVLLKTAGPIFNFILFLGVWQLTQVYMPIESEFPSWYKVLLQVFNFISVFAMINLLGFYYYTTARKSEDQLQEQIDAVRELHRIAQRDMDMAAQVQSTLFPESPPAVTGWEVAFVFEPMAKVSGDFYDFYYSDDELKGVALFDVSGHGIASGLITMIARSCFFRNFNKGDDKSLDTIVHEANHDLINEMGEVDNYLTGILLRFNGDKVQYVNAGHCDLLFRGGKTGRVVEVKHPERDIRGHFLGLAAVDSAYESLQFQVKQGDCLFLYSDCFLEAMNTEGEMYGEERLKQALFGSPGSTAEEVLQSVLKDFKAFVGSAEVKDDLTAIVVKRGD